MLGNDNAWKQELNSTGTLAGGVQMVPVSRQKMQASVWETLESRTLLSAAISLLPAFLQPVKASESTVVAPAFLSSATQAKATPAADSSEMELDQTWQSVSIKNPGQAFETSFDIVPDQQNSEFGVGLSIGTAKGFGKLGASVLFNVNNKIVVRKGHAGYYADNYITYTADTSYHIRMVIDPDTQTYSVYVTPKGKSEKLVAADFAFRSDKFDGTDFDSLSGFSGIGNATVNNIKITPSGTPAATGGGTKTGSGGTTGSGSTGSTGSTGSGSSSSSGSTGSGSSGSSSSTGGSTGSSGSSGSTGSSGSSGSTGSSGKPGASNTGPTTSTSNFTHYGSMTISTPNTVLRNISVTGTIYITAPNVTIDNFKIDADGEWYGIETKGNGSVTATNGEITDAAWAAIAGNNWTANRINAHDLGADAFKGGGNNLLENSWIHQIGGDPGAHADGFQAVNGTNMVIKGNNFDIPWRSTVGGVTYKVNSCIFLDGSLNGASFLRDTVISGNWLNGGNYAIYALKQVNTSVTNNIFGDDSQWGDKNGQTAVYSGNSDDY